MRLHITKKNKKSLLDTVFVDKQHIEEIIGN
jgi:hypothetical protein